MKIAVLADIHSNTRAFEKCLDDALKCGAREFWFLGDYCGDLSGVKQTMTMLYKVASAYPCTFIRGNKEDYWLGDENSRSDWRYGNDSTGTLLYTYDNLTEKDLKFFSSLPISTVKNGGQILLCHGRPNDNRRSLKDDETTLEIMESSGAPFIICGHTHKRMCLKHKGVTLLNPGSVGVSFNAKKVEYLLLDINDGQLEYEFKTLDYDVKGAIDEMYSSGLYDVAPCWARSTISILKYGVPDKPTVVNSVLSLAKARYGITEYNKVPEDCWLDGLKELGIE